MLREVLRGEVVVLLERHALVEAQPARRRLDVEVAAEQVGRDGVGVHGHAEFAFGYTPASFALRVSRAP